MKHCPYCGMPLIIPSWGDGGGYCDGCGYPFSPSEITDLPSAIPEAAIMLQSEQDAGPTVRQSANYA